MTRAVLVVVLTLFVAESSYGASRRRLVSMPQAKTSEQLIDAAEQRGEISAETALVYRVLADFDDPRLPPNLRGTVQSPAIDSSSVAEAVVRYDSLSESAKAILDPFLMPPFYEGSWANVIARPPAATATPVIKAPALCGPASDDWSSVLTPSGNVRIWWNKSNPGDAGTASGLATVADRAVLTFTALLGRSLIPDGGSSGFCRGGDDAIDVALVDTKSQTIPYYLGWKNVSSFILLDRNAPDTPAMTLVHELFHVFQYTYDVHDVGVITHYKWLAEATAQWAMHHYSPVEDSGKEQRAADKFLSKPDLPLYAVGDGHEYGAYLFFLYLTQKYGDATIRNIWNATLSADALNAVNNVIPGGFREQWPDFALEAWNREPANQFERTDGLTARAKAKEDRPADLGGGSDTSREMPIDMAPLTATYYRYVFSDPNVRLVHWINGLPMRLTRERLTAEGEDFGEFYNVAPGEQDVKDAAKVQALVKVGGIWRTHDWSNQRQVRFCRQKPDERIEELVLIYSNSQFRDPAKRLEHAAEPPILLFTNIACSGWRGETTFLDDTPIVWTAKATDLVFEYAGMFLEDNVLVGSRYDATGTGRAVISGSDSDCTYQGDQTFPLTPDGTRVFFVIHDSVPPSADTHRKYWGAMGDESPPVFSYTVKCGDDSDVAQAVPFFFFVEPLKYRVDPSGLRIEGRDDPLDGELTWEWKFQAAP